MKCVFCVKPGTEGLIHQTKHWNVLLAWDQSYAGRCIVALRRHCGDLDKVSRPEWG